MRGSIRVVIDIYKYFVDQIWNVIEMKAEMISGKFNNMNKEYMLGKFLLSFIFWFW